MRERNQSKVGRMARLKDAAETSTSRAATRTTASLVDDWLQLGG
jgi:hypothetical protein